MSDMWLTQELTGVLMAHFQSRLEVERTVSLVPWDRGLSTQVPAAENPEQQSPGTSTHGVCTLQGACQAAASTSAHGITAAMLARLQETGEGIPIVQVVYVTRLGLLSLLRLDICMPIEYMGGLACTADAISLVEYMVATGQAVRQGDVLKVTPGQSNAKPTITDADRKVLDFRIRGQSTSADSLGDW